MTISEVKSIVTANGGYFFNKDTMNFFGTKIETSVFKNGCFVTSEDNYDKTKRLYTVRRFNGKSIDTIGDFQQYKTKESAREAARKAERLYYWVAMDTKRQGNCSAR